MSRLHLALALCLLGLLAVSSLADDMAQTEDVDDTLERDAREADDSGQADVSRQKRHGEYLNICVKAVAINWCTYTQTCWQITKGAKRE